MNPRSRGSVAVPVGLLLAGWLSALIAVATPVAPAASAVSADPVIVAAGDNACGSNSTGASCREMATSDLVLGLQSTDRVDAVIPLGDVQYECGELANFNLADNSNPPRGYGRSWGRPSLLPITHPVVGNHEYRTDPTACLPQGPGAPGYFSYFGAKASPLDDGCTAACKGYYSYDLGSWHLITLNSNCGQTPGGCAAGSAQEKWLRADLAATTKSCVLASWHHPRYSSSTRATTGTQALWSDLYDAHADVVLTGHEHSYERFDLLGRGTSTSTDPTVDPQGLRQFVVGTGGRNLSAFAGTVRTGSQVRNDRTFGVLQMTLHSTSYTWSFKPIAGQTFTDSGTTACHAKGSAVPDTSPPSTPTGLTASVSQNQVGLSWTASSDDRAVTGYDVQRDGAVVASAVSGTAYTDTTVQPGRTYTYAVRARDAAGNVSAYGAPLTVTTPAALPAGTFAPVADARVQESSPGTNYGTSDLRVDAGPSKESYLRFTTQGLTAPVTSATLRLYATNGSADGPGLYRVSDSSWSESTLTWNNRPARASTATSDLGRISTGTWVEYDVTPLVTGNGTFSFALAGPSTDGTDFTSREGANAPRLVVSTSTSGGGGGTGPTASDVADVRVAEASPTTNYATSYLSADGGADPDVESYLRFQVSGVGTSHLTRATLRLFATNGSADGPALYDVTSDTWSETGTTWSTKPAHSSTPTEDKGKVPVNTWVEYDVTSLVQGDGPASFALVPTSSDATLFSSRESGTNHPQLVITTGP